MYDGFSQQKLDETCSLYCGQLPDSLKPTEAEFEQMWSLHPDEYHEIMMHGRLVKTPRWQQAFGHDYHYTNRTNTARPVPAELAPFLS